MEKPGASLASLVLRTAERLSPLRRLGCNAFAQRVHLCLSPPILAEYTAVLHRPKFGFEAHSIDALLEDLTRTALLVCPAMRLAVAPDEADNRFLECALEARATFLVTGNLWHFPRPAFEDIQILAPARFAHVLAERLRP